MIDTGRASAVQRTYDAVANAYDAQLRDELAHKPLDRALLAAFAELSADGPIADLGCGPGHVTQWLAQRHPDVIGIDLSPGMITVARERAPDLVFEVASMLDVPVADNAWTGAVAMYSIIHLSDAERAAACREFARAIRPGGWLLVAFHVDSPDYATGEVNHITDWFGEAVDIEGYFLDPSDVIVDLTAAGFELTSELRRQPLPDVEYPSRRCYLLARRAT